MMTCVGDHEFVSFFLYICIYAPAGFGIFLYTVWNICIYRGAGR